MKRIHNPNINTLRYWDGRHRKEDHLWNPEDIVARIAGHVLPHESVLDVGVGSAVVLRRLSAMVPGLTLLGCDFSPVAVRKLEEDPGGLAFERLFVHDVRKPLDGPLADSVVCTELLEHLQDPAGAVRNLAALARRMLAVSVPADGRISGPEHLWAFSEADVRELLAPYGEPEISRARRGIHFVGAVCLRS